MDYDQLVKWGNRLVLLVAFIIIGFGIYFFGGTKVTEKSAVAVCGGIIYNNVTKDFDIERITYTGLYTLTETKVELILRFGNGKRFSSDCMFRRTYWGGKIHVTEAYIIDEKGNLLIYDNLRIKYE